MDFFFLLKMKGEKFAIPQNSLLIINRIELVGILMRNINKKQKKNKMNEWEHLQARRKLFWFFFFYLFRRSYALI